MEVWPWRYIAADGRTGAEAVLVSMPKAVDICVYEPLPLVLVSTVAQLSDSESFMFL